MPFFERHVFVCASCMGPETEPSMDADMLQMGLAQRQLQQQVGLTQTGCLDICLPGASVVVYPENVWYAGVMNGDVEEIIEKHLVGGEPVERLRLYPTDESD